MIPILYEKNAVNFENNGIGHLTDTVSFKVTDERNSHPELTFQYPTSGIWYHRITEGSIIKGKANDTSELQLFRICKSSKPLNGIVTFYAKHISCDLKGIPLRALKMEKVTADTALSTAFAEAVLPHRFTAWSDITTLNDINIKKPRTLRNLCGGEDESVLEVFGGEYEFDNFTVKLHKNRGVDRGVVINYGKNLTDAKQERNIINCYTHFYPYAIKRTETRDDLGEAQEEIITLSEGALELLNPENIGHTKALTLDISDLFADGEEINETNLRTHANEYIATHKLGIPEVNITLSHAQIWDSPEYSNIAERERVALCDTVTVRFLDLGIDAQAKIIKTEYDGLAERFTKMEIGDPKSNFAATVNAMQHAADQYKAKLDDATRKIVRLKGDLLNVENKIPTKTSDLENDSNFVTQNYVKNEIANAQLGGDDSEIDLSGFATQDDLKTATKDLASKEDVETATKDLATKEEVETATKDLASKEDVETATKDLATKEEVETATKDLASKKDVETATKDLATKEEVETATKDLATKEDLENVENKIPDTNEFVTEEEVKKLIDDAIIESGEGSGSKENHSTVVYMGTGGEDCEAYFTIDVDFLLQNGSMLIDDLGIVAFGENLDDDYFLFGLSHADDILKVVIVADYAYSLTANAGLLQRDGSNWVWTPFDYESVSTLYVYSSVDFTELKQIMVIAKADRRWLE